MFGGVDLKVGYTGVQYSLVQEVDPEADYRTSDGDGGHQEVSCVENSGGAGVGMTEKPLVAGLEAGSGVGVCVNTLR